MKIFAYDLETTGTNPGQHSIHQIAGIILIDGKEKERFEIKMQPNPKAKIDPQALEVAGVTLEQIQSYQSFNEGYKELLSILGRYVDKYDKKDKLFTLGYNNASFDDNFLRGLFKQNLDDYYGSWFWADTLDVRVLAIRQLAPVRSQMENFKLMTVSKQLGIEVDESKLHDAVYDVELTYEVFKRLRLTKPELQELHSDFERHEAIQLAYEQLEEFDALPVQDQMNDELGQENIRIALNVLKKFVKPALTACLVFLMSFFFQIHDVQAQFKDKGPKNGNYRAWASKREFNGFKLNSGQRKSLGLKNGLFNIGIAKNWKIFQGKRKPKLTNRQVTAIRKEYEDQPKTNQTP